MSLTNYTELKASIASWLNKTNLTDQIPDFITLAEAKMRRELKTRHQVESMDLTIDAEEWGLPCGFDGVVSLRTDYGVIEYRPIDAFDDSLSAGHPSTYTIIGDSLHFSPVPSSAVDAKLRYRTLFCGLSSSVRSNWVLDKHPDAYLYGALLQAAPFLEHDERIPVWASLFRAALDAINAQALEQQHGANLRIQSGPTP